MHRTTSIPAKAGKTLIQHVVVMGDSLSDRGTAMKRKIGGVIPMRWLLGWELKTHNDRCSNAELWDDDFCAMIAGGFLAQHFMKARSEHKAIHDTTDIADGIIDHDLHIRVEAQRAYNLDDDKAVTYNNTDFFRSFCEAGLTAHDYSHDFTWHPTLELIRKTVSNIDEQRKKLFDSDIAKNVTDEVKAKTLVLELSGGNDLITANFAPAKEDAIKAVVARIQNLQELIAKGYRHFVLFTLPDVSVTPWFHEKTEAERQTASEVCKFFNDILIDGCNKVLAEAQKSHPQVTIDIFDSNKTLNDVLTHPEKYGVDKDKIYTPFSTSDEYHGDVDGPLPAPAYTFWDRIHPSGLTHEILANAFYEMCVPKFDFEAPDPTKLPTINLSDKVSDIGPEQMYEQFIAVYRRKLEADKNGWTGRIRRSRLFDDLRQEQPLDTDALDLLVAERRFLDIIAKILNHALNGYGYRTHEVLVELGWLGKKGEINVSIDVLMKAKDFLAAQPKDHHQATVSKGWIW